MYMLVTNDEYELPLAVGESVHELGAMLGVKGSSIWQRISHQKHEKFTHAKYKYIKVDVAACEKCKLYPCGNNLESEYCLENYKEKVRRRKMKSNKTGDCVFYKKKKRDCRALKQAYCLSGEECKFYKSCKFYDEMGAPKNE